MKRQIESSHERHLRLNKDLIEQDEAKEAQEAKEPKFRFYGKTMFCTIKTHCGAKFVEHVNTIYPVKKWLYAEELGSKTHDYEHTHIVLEFYKSIEFRNSRKLDMGKLHPKIEPLKSWAASTKYLSKETKYVANFDAEELFKGLAPFIQKVADAPTDFEAIKQNAKSLKDIVPIIAIRKTKGGYINHDYINEISRAKLRPWQVEALEILKDTSDRHVYWIYEDKGNVGKTFFLKYVLATGIDDTCIFSGAGSPKDLLHILSKFISRNNHEPKYCLINLPRICEDRIGIYSFIEMLKDGLITTTKYDGDTYLIRPPVVIVMANWLPQLQNTLSLDRFRVSKITMNDDESSLSLSPVTLKGEREHMFEDEE